MFGTPLRGYTLSVNFFYKQSTATRLDVQTSEITRSIPLLSPHTPSLPHCVLLISYAYHALLFLCAAYGKVNQLLNTFIKYSIMPMYSYASDMLDVKVL